ncbi:hypothetical protein ED92_17635 [Amycolatopsis sp. MJM2582]|uniref:hypothetical protein n=1 Tax=Amycolatopsis sp. MJM2582 TaxID=1427749 RepID=UPI000503C369|nr:hypothetical protein [Amycolatopsis sp. MJM2582]KFZ82043.1 hypothetical protein ED92_17635 [Amycolatopsis sp. MJM2582]
MSQPVAEPSPVPGIIAAELQVAARGSAGGWSGQIRSWPGKVVPGNDRQITAAVLTLIGNARWPRDQARELTALFAPLYRAGWCNEAIVRMLDTDPDGTRRPPWLSDRDTPTIGPLKSYLARRLHAWIPAEPDEQDDTRDITRLPSELPDPPIAGTTFRSWAERMRLVYGDAERRAPAAPGSAGPDRRGGQVTPLERRREAVRRRQRALGALWERGERERYENDPAITADTALLLDPGVYDAVVIAARTGDRAQIARLRRAVRLARLDAAAQPAREVDAGRAAEIRQLAQTITRRDGSVIPLGSLALLLADMA